MFNSQNIDERGAVAWPVALAAVTVLGSLASACMLPFVALGVATAATMPRPRAAATLGVVWGINQLLGFTVMGYPPTPDAFAWGVALGLATLVTMFVASRLLGDQRRTPLRLIAAFAGGFAAYEGALFGFALIAGGTGTFTPAIVLMILRNDAMWCVGLLALHVVLTRAAPRLFGPTLSPRLA